MPSLEEKTGRYEYNHLLLLARRQRRLPQSAQADDAGPHARLPGAPAHGQEDAGRARRGADRHVGLPLRRDSRTAAQGRPQRRAGGGALVSGCLRAGKFLHRGAGPRRAGFAAGQAQSDALRPRRETGAPLLATNDLHYVAASDAEAQDVLLCVQTGKTLERSQAHEVRQLSSTTSRRPTRWRGSSQSCPRR